MQKIYDNLYVGNHNDAYNSLYVWSAIGEERVNAVLDVTPDLPTKKWHRAKGITLKKIGFASGKPFERAKVKKCIEFIHESRRHQKSVMVVCRNGQHRSVMICLAYLAFNKGWSFEDTFVKIQNVLGEVELKQPYVDSVLRFLAPGVSKVPEPVKVEESSSSTTVEGATATSKA